MRNPLGYLYPAGAENDPAAPWNKRTEESCERCGGSGFKPCPQCKQSDGEGCEVCQREGLEPCESCDSTGTEHQPTSEEIAEDKADMARDERDEL